VDSLLKRSRITTPKYLSTLAESSTSCPSSTTLMLSSQWSSNFYYIVTMFTTRKDSIHDIVTFFASCNLYSSSSLV
jgi:hypothetical protein